MLTLDAADGCEANHGFCLIPERISVVTHQSLKTSHFAKLYTKNNRAYLGSLHRIQAAWNQSTINTDNNPNKITSIAKDRLYLIFKTKRALLSTKR